MVVLTENSESLKNQESVLASCDMCLVHFLNEDQINQHILYHQSPEFHNDWVDARLQKFKSDEFEGEKLEKIPIGEPSENYKKYKPNCENSISKPPPIQSDWELSWEDWNNTKGQKPVEEKEIFPTCSFCGEQFLHENTKKICEESHIRNAGAVKPSEALKDM